ncbi:MAG: type I methionyl aminopeptidase [Chlamydiae bacterium RIFCSPHIGHO2_12_FULL_44_59]|nr:MAG: type I methionyl aminopeptidase [Chlamydiae bacterium RIFCSPHIGHO2_01_FULL_44_39]OGN61036.1 MAG: type I methionyl aminopeptidase [Chlamydiae bacterium RIFCSPHIGHO2_12_FULL_44_59]OGN66812.1 MAG: type I methionyl aminopeptidase [Chlamydiae bacterium RIFCSPLOWO2_01_FULL_44_52]OGN70010.1 MAG: type I methionyl aminopeptidase [Chlamydiae bacterium RIFCSPLOWO2_02_FULL_45_22]OGN71083.1 MAG: type I methionyl aminopeptidase [Chlamydiae bacterium RIFCSPLOWO2_12_FULL_45_20]
MGRNDSCWCGSGKKWKKCHYPEFPADLTLAQQYLKNYRIVLKTPEQVEKIGRACKITAKILDELCKAAKPGVTTQSLDELSRQLHSKAGATPAPLGYGSPPYPKSICTSLNEVICHGIPDERPLQEGDILNIDVSSIVDGFFGDCSRMVMIGNVSEEKRHVVEVALRCLNLAINVCRPGNAIWQIGKAIEDYATSCGCSVVNQFVGHGVGISFHEPPEIPHHYNQIMTPFAPGMIFTIEPMINAGVREGILDPKDRWTVRTKDLKPSAQWEHTLLITEKGHEILTIP